MPRKSPRLRGSTRPSAPAPADETACGFTLAAGLLELEEARAVALVRGQAAAAVSATMAKVKLAGLPDAPDGAPTAEPEISLHDAARRIAFLLHLADTAENRDDDSCASPTTDSSTASQP
jgi:hypothetical protein